MNTMFLLNSLLSGTYNISDRPQSKTLLTIDERGKKSLKTMFSTALFLTIFDLRSSIVLTFDIAAYPVCY